MFYICAYTLLAYMTNIQLTELFNGAIHYYLKVTPGTHVRVTHGDKWILKSTDEHLQDYDKRKDARTFSRKKQLVRANKHREELIWNAKKEGFDLKKGCFLMAFMKHMPKTWKKGIRKPGRRDLMAWQPMKVRPDVDNYFKKLADSLMKEDSEIWCAAIMKIWVPDEIEEGTYCINIPSFFEFAIQYLRDKLRDQVLFS